MAVRDLLSPWIHPTNIRLSEQFNYGHREVLLATNGMDLSSLILGSIPHGWGPDIPGFPYPQLMDRRFRKYPILAWSERQRDSFAEKNYKRVFAIGAPWAHLLKSLAVELESECLDKSDSSTPKLLFFPSHSGPGASAIMTEYDERPFLAFEKAEVTVSLFWLDYVAPSIRNYYLEKGFRVNCAGYKGGSGIDVPWDPNGGRVMFLPHLYQMLSQHSHVMVDTMSTAFLYAASLGKVIWVRSNEESHTWWNNPNQLNLNLSLKDFLNSLDSHIGNFPKETWVETKGIIQNAALNELGWNITKNFSSLAVQEQFLRKKAVNPDVATELASFVGYSESLTTN